MFTGIVQAMGEIAAVEPRGDDMRLRVRAPALGLEDVRRGDSIAVSGVCLTVIEQRKDGFAVDVSRATLSCTTLGDLRTGAPVNLEKALLPTTRLGGHLVSGHVDGVGVVAELRAIGGSRRLRVTAPAALGRYLAPKGSVCVDGVSLTVNDVEGSAFEVNLIPHTLQCTVTGGYRPGTRVNIEVDILARYVERLLAPPAATGGGRDTGGGITSEFLEQHGFLGAGTQGR